MLYTTKLFAVVVVLVSLLSNGQSLDSMEYCTDPAGKQGQCIPIYECASLLRLFQQKPIPYAHIEFVKNSRCLAPNVRDPLKLVCCAVEKLPMKPNCGFGESDRLLGGQLAFVSEFPWNAIIEYRHRTNGEVRLRCGATLINSRYVITAAHCVSSDSNDWEVSGIRLGEHNLKTTQDCEFDSCAAPVIITGIEKIIVHDGYSSQSKDNHDDIALIRLDRKIEFSEDIAPICLPLMESYRTANITGSWSKSSGWGLSRNAIISHEKLKVQLNVLDRKKCSNLNGISLKDTQFCTHIRSDREICIVDSGGSLILRYREAPMHNILYGIASFGKHDNCGVESDPAVFTDVTKYIDWIEMNIKK